MSRILALDLSLTATGICEPHGSTWATSTIRTTATQVLEARCHRIAREIGILATHLSDSDTAADLVVIEDYALHGPGDKGKTGMVHGAVRSHLWQLGFPMLFVSPNTLKKYATGKGNSGKPAMLAEAIKRLGFDGHDDNEVDALWLYALGCHVTGNPIVDLPQTHLSALDKLDLSVLEGVTS